MISDNLILKSRVIPSSGAVKEVAVLPSGGGSFRCRERAGGVAGMAGGAITGKCWAWVFALPYHISTPRTPGPALSLVLGVAGCNSRAGLRSIPALADRKIMRSMR